MSDVALMTPETLGARAGALVGTERVGFLTVSTFDQACKVADFIAKSQLVPEAYRGKPADIVIAMQLGMELGLAPLQALQSIAVINGRPALWGDAMKGLVIGLAECEDVLEDEPTGDDAEKWVATCTIKRRHRSAVVRTFSWSDAKVAGLAGKAGPWKQYPKRMLMLRARGFALRDAFPDRLRGIITAEEAHDYPTPSPAPSITIAEPRRIGESSTVPAPPASSDTPERDAAAPAPTPAPSRPPSAGATDQTVSGVRVTDTGFQRDKDERALYEVTTSQGLFYTRDEALYHALAVLEGTDHTATIVFRIARGNGGRTARVVVAVTVDEPAATDAAPAADGGDQ